MLLKCEKGLRSIKIFLLFIIFFSEANTFGQSFVIKGRVTDSLQNPLSFANIMLHQANSQQAVRFALTGADGRFEIKAEINKTYTLTISYFGYKAYRKHFTAEKKEYNLQVVLYENKQELDKVTIQYTVPVVVKKDTTTYNAGSFTNGTERSLKDVLKKMPGVQVDDNGKIKVNGKSVTQVYVENKKFFNGNSKLAIENIPADAVDKIQAIDHFQNVSFMKSFEDSKKMILNIKLKEGKKNFVFGDAEIRKGFQEAYLADLKTFYYSPKKTFNYIGTVNNINEKVLTFNDLLSFTSNDDRIENIEETRENYKFISSFLPRDYYASKANFQAVQGQTEIKPSLNTSIYAIYSQNNDKGLQNSLQTDLNNVHKDLLTQQNTSDKNRFGLGQLKLDFDPNTNTKIRYKLFIIHTATAQRTQNFYTLDHVLDTIFNEGANDITSFRQNVNYFHRINIKNAFKARLQYNYSYNTKDKLSQSFSKPYFVPVLWQNLYRINTQNQDVNYKAAFNFKYYLVLTPVKHIYPSFGFLYRKSIVSSKANQILESAQAYALPNFDNELDAVAKTYYGSLAYKVKWGDVTLKSGLKLNVFNWNLNAYDIHKTKTQALPFLYFEANTGYAKYKLEYTFQSRLPDMRDWLGGQQFVDFKTLHKGNPELDLEKNHEIKLSLFYFDLTKGNTLLGDVSYRYYNQYFTSKITFDKFNVILQKITLKQPKESWRLYTFYRKELVGFYYSLSPGISYDSYQNELNGVFISNRIVNYNMNVGVGTKFKILPNINITNAFSRLINHTIRQTQIDNWSLKLKLTYQLHKFYTQLHYRYQKSIIQNAETTANNYLDFKADYNFSDKSWYVGLDFRNILNQNEKIKTFQTDYLMIQKFTRTYPRLLLMKVGYKF